jgi:hypothetical protein
MRLISKMNLNKKCPQCKNIYLVRSLSEVASRIYCSKNCQIDSKKKTKIEIKCKECGELFLRLPCLKNSQYCSKKCKYLSSRKTKNDNLRICNKCKITKIKKDFSGLKEYICKKCRASISIEKRYLPNKRFSFSKSCAKRRNLLWNISFEDYCNFINKECHYCLEKIENSGIGLDRKNNLKGYELNNVVPCCGDCNITRSNKYSYEEMLLLAETIKIIKCNRKSKMR